MWLIDKLYEWALRKLEFMDLVDIARKKIPLFSHEETLLCNFLINPNLLDKGWIKPEDMLFDIHKTIFNAMKQLRKAGRDVDLINLKDELEKDKLLHKAGGVEYLSSIIDASNTTAGTRWLCAKIRNECTKVINKLKGEQENGSNY